MSLRSSVKSALLPAGAAFRRLPFGLAKGAVMNIDFAHQARLYFGLYEREIAADCIRLLAASGCAFDIGAHDGYYALALARHTGGPVLAVEPDRESQEKLAANLSRNRADIRVEAAFVCATPGDNGVTLDGLAAGHFAPDFIKMDIEGGELAALEGGQGLLASHRPHLVIEVHSRSLDEDCRRLLEGHGYSPRRVAPRAFLAELRPGEYNGWLICEGRPHSPKREPEG